MFRSSRSSRRRVRWRAIASLAARPCPSSPTCCPWLILGTSPDRSTRRDRDRGMRWRRIPSPPVMATDLFWPWRATASGTRLVRRVMPADGPWRSYDDGALPRRWPPRGLGGLGREAVPPAVRSTTSADPPVMSTPPRDRPVGVGRRIMERREAGVTPVTRRVSCAMTLGAPSPSSGLHQTARRSGSTVSSTQLR